MLRIPPLVVSVLLGLAGCAGAPAPQGTEPPRQDGAPARPPFLVYETTGRKIMVDAFDKEREEKLAQRIYASEKGLRTEMKAAGLAEAGPAGILRLDRKLMWQLNASDRTYTEVTFAEAAESVRGVRALLAERLKSGKLTPEKRRQLEVALGQRQPRVEVKADPETVELLGRKCRHVRYLEDGELRIEEWAAENLVIPCDMSEVRALTGDFSPGLLKELKRRQSFALKARIFGRLPGSGIPRLAEFEVTKLELPEKLDPALFEVPVGYKLAKPGAKTE